MTLVCLSFVVALGGLVALILLIHTLGKSGKEKGIRLIVTCCLFN